MNKENIINEIKNMIINYGTDNYLSLHNLMVFSNDYCKYDLMAIWIDDNDNIIIEGIGYNSLELSLFYAKEMSFKTLVAIKKKIEKYFSKIDSLA